MKAFFIKLAIISLLPLSATADPVCETVKECQALKKQAQQRIDLLKNKIISFEAYGLNFEEAKSFCESKNLRLPTIREFSEQYGESILEVNQEYLAISPESYSNLVFTVDNNGEEDIFDFKKKQYHDWTAWSSSPFMNPTYKGAADFYTFSSGQVEAHKTDISSFSKVRKYFVVKCIK